MQKKLSLDVDALVVETFEPAQPVAERGTVHAREGSNGSADPYVCCITGDDPRCFTFISECLTDCGCGTGHTERVTECAGTCDD